VTSFTNVDVPMAQYPVGHRAGIAWRGQSSYPERNSASVRRASVLVLVLLVVPADRLKTTEVVAVLETTTPRSHQMRPYACRGYATNEPSVKASVEWLAGCCCQSWFWVVRFWTWATYEGSHVHGLLKRSVVAISTTST